MPILGRLRKGFPPRFLCVLALMPLLGLGLIYNAMAVEVEPPAQRTYICPLGGQSFTGPNTAPVRYAIHQLDLKGAGSIAPLPRCPGNGLVLYKLEYAAAEKAKLSRLLADAVFRKSMSGHSTHYQAAMILQAMNAGADQVARFFLAAVWDAQAMEGLPPPPYAQWRGLYLRRAIDALDTYLGQYGSKDPSAVKLDILAAELQRQRGEFKDALRRLDSLPALGPLSQRFERRWVRRLRAEIAVKNRRPALLAHGEGVATLASNALIAVAGSIFDRAAVAWSQDPAAATGVASAKADSTAGESDELAPLLRPSLP